MTDIINIHGATFGRLLVTSETSFLKNGVRVWGCLCSCGVETTVRSQSLRYGKTKSCGCLHDESAKTRFTKHGATVGGVSNVYYVWAAMKQRALNPNNKDYKHYGGKGAAICERWLDFSNFIADMGERPPGMMIERKDNDLGYSKENCYWAARKRQLDNRSVTMWVNMPDGAIKTASDAFRQLGCSKSMFFRKIKNPEGFLGCTLVSK